ncbi:nephrin-like isoform X1 [Macrobrachium nipponense]|uniref:nephrin-like isoform X1 n=1 Tax=Macrobrachium nipponense TaxID=159736 RepID=UPI0030C8B05E
MKSTFSRFVEPQDRAVGLLLLVSTLSSVRGMSAQEQKFTVYPDSVEVNEGDDVFLSCVVQNQQGKAQWTKDGFALGFERDVPGYPRYSYSGDSEKGEHHLVIHGITLEDDGEYQCQVGPTAKTSALWASANVTVMVSPSSISILGGIDGEPVVAVADKQLRIQCLVKEARPAPSVAWYRNGIMLDQNTHTERAEPSTQFKRWNVRSRLTLTPKPEDDGQQFSCRALHPSLMNSPTSLVASVTLSVLHLPEPPVISGYKTGEILKEGQDITLTCKCEGGNPRPRLGWYKNGKLLNHPNTTYTKATKENDFVKSSLALQVKADDDRATFECRVTKNDILNHPLSDNVTFTVHYSPKRVFVTGPSVATAGEEFTLTCVTSKSNPSAAINWLVHGMQVATVASLISETDDGGWVTSSDLKYYLDRSLALSEITVDCTAHNPASDRMVSESHVISIIKPPGRPFIKVEGAGEVVAGGRMAIICTSEGGNPHPGITIYKGHTKLLTKVVIDGRVTRARAITDVVASDNGIKVSCEVANPAIRAPLVAHTKVKLLFPPWEVSAWVSPAHVDAGQVISLVCESTSSLPPSRVSWRSGPLMLHGATSSQSPGLYGGTVTKSVLEVRALIEDNGRVFTCDANNGLGTTVTTNVTLNVLHGPIWVTVPTGTIEVQEKDDLILTAAANANPPPVSYTWWRGPLKIEGLSSSDGEDTEGRLEIRRIHRQEAGAYSVTATSPRGRVNASFIINILYGPESVLASKRVTVDEDGSTSVLCSAVGNPAPNVTWFRQDQYSSIREILTWGINEARLPIQYASRSDTGFYYCLASNVVATSAPVKTAVVVTRKF